MTSSNFGNRGRDCSGTNFVSRARNDFPERNGVRTHRCTVHPWFALLTTHNFSIRRAGGCRLAPGRLLEVSTAECPVPSGQVRLVRWCVCWASRRARRSAASSTDVTDPPTTQDPRLNVRRHPRKAAFSFLAIGSWELGLLSELAGMAANCNKGL